MPTDNDLLGGSSTSSTISRKNKNTKQRKTAPTTSRSDSECESAPPTVPKKKSASRPRTSSKSKDLFGLLSDEDAGVEPAHQQSARRKLDRSLTTKVANGAVRKVAQLAGAYYVEVRVYNTRDALKSLPEERYKKALVTLKSQLNTDTNEWQDLQRFMKSAKTLFEDKDPVFYSDKVNFKL